MLDPDFWLHRSLALDAITNFFYIFVYWQKFSHSVSFECCSSALSAVPKQYSCIQSATSVLQQVSLAGILLYSRWTPPDRELLTFLNVYDQPCHQHSCLSTIGQPAFPFTPAHTLNSLPQQVTVAPLFSLSFPWLQSVHAVTRVIFVTSVLCSLHCNAFPVVQLEV